MINLYLQYVSFWNFHREKRIKMKLYRLSMSDTLQKVGEIKGEEAKNTILLLDALDEDPYIIPKDTSISDEEAFRKRVDEIIEVTKDFREVILTCRTQYFSGQESDPYELKILRPDEEGYYTLNKLYISPFEDIEIKSYLNKKYPFWQLWKRKDKQRAKNIVQNSPKLVVRPMLLSYIDLLIEDDKSYGNVYEIYESLIEKWLLREAKKRKPEREREKFMENLRALSDHAAQKILDINSSNKGLYLTKEQALSLAQTHHIELKPDEVTGKSLLTCDGQGNWKFAHKSILEFFLAKRCLDDLSFFIKMIKSDFAGMDMVKTFYSDKRQISFIFVEGGEFSREKSTIKLSSFLLGRTPVTQSEWEDIMGNNPSHFKGASHLVEYISWYDAVEFCNRLSSRYGFVPYYEVNEKFITINEQGNGFRLPTEAEWEFAARGGIKSRRYKYAGSDNIDEVAWYRENSGSKSHPVGEKKANEIGLCDMSGNVWEWCYDWYGEYEAENEVNPVGASSGSLRVVRGGSWLDIADYCKVAYRDGYSPGIHFSLVGFRLAISL